MVGIRAQAPYDTVLESDVNASPGEALSSQHSGHCRILPQRGESIVRRRIASRSMKPLVEQVVDQVFLSPDGRGIRGSVLW